MSELIEQCKILKVMSRTLALASARDKNQALRLVKESLDQARASILDANQKDISKARQSGMAESLLDRLALNQARIDGMLTAIDELIAYPDPIWSGNKTWTTEESLVISRINVPLGVIGIIYESRPNVTLDAFALALKSGNAIILRGSSSAYHSNLAIVKAIKAGLAKSQISPDMIQLIEDPDYGVVDRLIKLNQYIDLIIPRGGAGLIQSIIQNATVPTLQTGTGNCHIYVDETADLEDALNIIDNAKKQRPGTCNSVETVLVHQTIAQNFLPKLAQKLGPQVELRACPLSLHYIEAKPASEEDWSTEYLDLILAIKVVSGVDEAIDHINRYGSQHSEAILTQNIENSDKFQRQVDAAVVYVNASTRFTDGGVFGFGGEMGISNQKIHARGPVGVDQLVSYKYLVHGQGQTRQ